MSILAQPIDTLTPEELDELSAQIALARKSQRKQRVLSLAESTLWTTLQELFPDECGKAIYERFVTGYGVQKFADRADQFAAIVQQSCRLDMRRAARDGVRLLLLRTLKDYLGSFILYNQARTLNQSFDKVQEFIVEDKDLQADNVALLVKRLDNLEARLDAQPEPGAYTEKPYVGPYYLLNKFTHIRHAMNDQYPGYIEAGMLTMALVPLPRSD